MKKTQSVLLIIVSLFSGCAPQVARAPQMTPAAFYSQQVKQQSRAEVRQAAYGTPRARWASEGVEAGIEPTLLDEQHYENHIGQRDYNGPLSMGDPGVTASLWRESSGRSDIYRDERAFRPMDLVTIVVSEQSEGTKKADTKSESETTITAAITRLLGLESELTEKASNISPAALVDANTSFEFDGKGETKRRDSLTARISAMVVEVLPSGILRVEGQKIIAMNSEEQVMVISGLVRPRDISSRNEVDSAKVANMRIDYFGRGDVADSVKAGWFGRALRKVWPF